MMYTLSRYSVRIRKKILGEVKSTRNTVFTYPSFFKEKKMKFGIIPKKFSKSIENFKFVCCYFSSRRNWRLIR